MAWNTLCRNLDYAARTVQNTFSMKKAAAVQVTAVGLLRESAVPKGEWLMLTAAGSSIGRQIIQIGKSYNLRVIAIVRRSEDRTKLLRLGQVLIFNPICVNFNCTLQLHDEYLRCRRMVLVLL